MHVNLLPRGRPFFYRLATLEDNRNLGEADDAPAAVRRVQEVMMISNGRRCYLGLSRTHFSID